jgi:hypothetical protein
VLNAFSRNSGALRATTFFALEGERLQPRSHAHAHAHTHAHTHTRANTLSSSCCRVPARSIPWRPRGDKSNAASGGVTGGGGGGGASVGIRSDIGASSGIGASSRISASSGTPHFAAGTTMKRTKSLGAISGIPHFASSTDIARSRARQEAQRVACAAADADAYATLRRLPPLPPTLLAPTPMLRETDKKGATLRFAGAANNGKSQAKSPTFAVRTDSRDQDRDQAKASYGDDSNSNKGAARRGSLMVFSSSGSGHAKSRTVREKDDSR